MKDNQFDDLVRNRLQNQKSSVPENMWERIVKHKEERKGRFALRACLLIASLAIFGYMCTDFLFYIKTKNNKDATFEKNNICDKTVKENINEVIHNKRDSLDASSINKVDRREKIDNVAQKNKIINDYSFSIRKNERSENFYNQYQFLKSADLLKDSNSLIKIKDTSNYNNSNIDSLIRKPTQEIIKQDSSESFKIKEQEVDNEKFSVEAYVSPDMPFNRINSENKSYERLLKAASTMRLSYTFGARINYEITKEIAAKIGIQYTQVNEKIIFADSVPTHSFTSINRYRTIGVPIIINYKPRWFSNLNLSFNPGIVLNIDSRYKGAIPTIYGEQIDVKNNNVYDKNVSVTLYLGMDISRKINRKVDFFAEPWFSYQLKNSVNAFYLFHQKIHTLGLSLGLRYRLFKNEAK